jgi:DNA polymerase I-like protein with 3'-5' exonuclease and polymerase domains
MALVKLYHDMKGMQSVICNTVHDSIVIDVYPGEEEQCIEVMSKAMLCLSQETKRRYNKEYTMPVGIELKMGKNWLDLEAVFEV